MNKQFCANSAFETNGKYAQQFIIAAAIFLVILIAPNADAASVTASSCSQANVQAAITSASSGDTVIMPSGTCTWQSTVSIPSNKGITLQGAGVGATIILIGHGGAGIKISTGSGVKYRVTGFTLRALKESGLGNEDLSAMISVVGKSQESNWRIDNIRFDDQPVSLHPYGVAVSGPTYGVIDHCTFDSIGQAVFVQEGLAEDAVSYGDISWTRPVDFGGPRAVYIEDCVFTGRIANQEQVYDGRYGGRIVFRNNQVTDYWIEPHSGCPNGGRAVLHNEVYRNTFKDTVAGGGGTWLAVRIRGGTGVIFDNTIEDPDNSQLIMIDNQRSCLSCGGTWAGNPCDGNSKYDGNTPGYQGWPCIDQIGRGANQASEPMYAWGNTLNKASIGIQKYGLCSRETEYHLVEGRDYFNGVQKPGYTPYTYPHPLISGIVAQTCLQQYGTCCSSGNTCVGTTKSASDCTTCCTGTCQSQQTCIAGDLNCDKKVDIFDLVLVAQNYAKTSGFDIKADANKDGKIDIFDLVLVAQNYGKTG